VIQEAIYPPGGWGRALNYIWLRLRRLPDPPHRIARGVAAGAFISCSPFIGIHIVMAMGIAWMVRGNVVAGVIGTGLGNPVTFPMIAAASLSTGNWILGHHHLIGFREMMRAFGEATHDLKHNFMSIFTGHPAHWDGLAIFNHDIFMPYLIGGFVNGLVLAAVCYGLAHPFIDAYQRRRSRVLKKKIEARLKKGTPAV